MHKSLDVNICCSGCYKSSYKQFVAVLMHITVMVFHLWGRWHRALLLVVTFIKPEFPPESMWVCSGSFKILTVRTWNRQDQTKNKLNIYIYQKEIRVKGTSLVWWFVTKYFWKRHCPCLNSVFFSVPLFKCINYSTIHVTWTSVPPLKIHKPASQLLAYTSVSCPVWWSSSASLSIHLNITQHKLNFLSFPSLSCFP